MLTFLLGATVLAGCAAWSDLRSGNVSNRLTGFGLAAAIIGHFVRGAVIDGARAGLREATLALGGALICSLVPLFMYARGALGAGDVKLFAALGAALHPLVGLEAETYAFVAAAIIAPAKLAWEGALLRTLWNTVTLVTNPLRPEGRKKELPEAMRAWFRLGPAVFVGTVATLIVHVFSLRAMP